MRKSEELNLPRHLSIRITKKWIDLRLKLSITLMNIILKVTFKSKNKAKTTKKFPNLLYSLSKEAYRNTQNDWRKKSIKAKKKRFESRKKKTCG